MMKIKLKKWLTPVVMLSFGVASLSHAQTTEETELAQEPLQTMVQRADPNVQLLLEAGSGVVTPMIDSAHLGYAIFGSNSGNSSSESSYYANDIGLVSPWINGFVDYNLTNAFRSVVASQPNNLASALARSPQTNKLYYNPAEEYKPWLMPDGQRMANADPRNAKVFASWERYVDIPGAEQMLSVVDLTAVDTPIPYRGSQVVGGSFYYCDRVSVPFIVDPCRRTTEDDLETPALYFIYKGPGKLDRNLRFNPLSDPYDRNAPAVFEYPGVMDINNYDAYVIMEHPTLNISQMYSSAGYNLTDPSAPGYVKIDRPDCKVSSGDPSGQVVCTREEELQNFANWFVYYRGQWRTTIAAAYEVMFDPELGNKFRFGYGINGESFQVATGFKNYTGVKELPKPFTDERKQKFFEYLLKNEYVLDQQNNQISLPWAFHSIAGYFSDKSEWGAWAETYGEPTVAAQQNGCRKNHVIIMTGSNYSNDLSTGMLIDNSDANKGAPYANPYLTLADVSMRIWANDLRPDLANNVETQGIDTANWQHVQTHVVAIGAVGTLNPETDLPALTSGEKNWGNPRLTGANLDTNVQQRRADDLWHTALNGRGVYEVPRSLDDIKESLRNIFTLVKKSSGAGAHRVTATNYLEASNRIYKSSYLTGNWTGDLTSYTVVNKETGNVANEKVWSAVEHLPAAEARNIWIGSKENALAERGHVLEFKWSSVKSDAYLAEKVFNSSVEKENEFLINYLRGDNSLISTMGYRDRMDGVTDTGVGYLGDIVNATPVYVGTSASLAYNKLPVTAYGKGQYLEYVKWKKTRTPMVFIGANDGMLHAFNAKDPDEGGGVETFAYIPSFLAQRLPALANPNFEGDHRYYLDGALTLTDAPIGEGVCSTTGFLVTYDCWRNVLLGSAGAGEKAVFALDVTDPEAYAGTPTRAQIENTILWELTSESAGMQDLGYVLQPLQAGYVRNGENSGSWVGIFANGAHSASGVAALFVVDLATGQLLKQITVDTTGDNGLMGVTLLYDERRVVIGAYAGDLKGNMWRFDLSSHNLNDWGTKFKNTSTGEPQPFFKGAYGAITAAPAVIDYAWIQNGESKQGYMVLFGTGKYFDVSDKYSSISTQLYGVIDKGVWGNQSSSSNSLASRFITETTISGDTYYEMNSTVNGNYPITEYQIGWTVNMNIGTMKDYRTRSILTPVVTGSTVYFPIMNLGKATSATADCAPTDYKTGVVAVNAMTGLPPNIKWVDSNNDGIIDENDIDIVGYPTEEDGLDILFGENLSGGNVSDGVVCGKGYFLQVVNGRPGCAKALDNAVWEQLI